MIAEAQHKQFTLKDDGQIYFQPDSTNPLAGDVLATLTKGDNILQPRVVLAEGRDLGAESAESVLAAVETWVKVHIYTVLEPLFHLVSDDTMPDPVKDIALKLFAHTGIIPRVDIEESIAKLDPDMRKTLRDKKVRLGPVLVFLPDLNKPSAVRLRALLWYLFHDQSLPAPVPRDGAMSFVVDTSTANPDFYRAIGYPLYGPRVIRIDMLDRVINAIYDSAQQGRFQAQHKMAEWMGCPIADLYAILEAMGHKRLINQPKPAPETTVETAAETVSELVPQPVCAIPVPPTPAPTSLLDIMEAPQAPQPAVEVTEMPQPEKKQEQKKPELDWFLLRRGKANSSTQTGHAEKTERPPKKEFSKPDKKSFPAERYAAKGDKGTKSDKNFGDDKIKKFDKKSSDDRDDKKSFKKKKFDDKGRDDKNDARQSRVYSAPAAVSDNPFAILQNLKLK